jgi:hypothetical protein
MSSTTIRFDKESRVLSQFERTVRNAQRSSVPTFTERELAYSANRKAPKPQPARISFYNPNNPLNGFAGKRKVDQIAILEKIKADKKAAK